MKNYKITCPSIFIAHVVYDFLDSTSLGVDNINNKTVYLRSDKDLDELYSIFAGTSFEIVIQELNDNGNLIRQKMTP